MVLLSIGCSKDSSSVYDSLTEICKYYKEKNINIAIYENNVGNMHYTKCILKDNENDVVLFTQYRDMFYSYAANILYSFLSKEYIVEMLQRVVEDNYNYMDKDDIEDIKNRCISILMGTGVFTSEGMVYSMSCRNSIIRRIEEFLHESSEIILDGFITFRLKEINNSIKEIVDKVAEEYVLEKEYSEFIKLLKYFIEIQDSKYDLVNIMIDKNGDYIVEDKDFKNISNEFFEDFNIDNIKGDINKHDILVSAIITSAPKRIVIHGVSNCQSPETIDTLESIFGESIKICPGCDVCKSLDLEINTERKS